MNLTCSIILLWSDGNISSPEEIHIHQFYLMIMLIFPLLLCQCQIVVFLSLMSIVMIGFNILSKRFFLKREELFDARVVSITKKELVLQYSFHKDS